MMLLSLGRRALSFEAVAIGKIWGTQRLGSLRNDYCAWSMVFQAWPHSVHGGVFRPDYLPVRRGARSGCDAGHGDASLCSCDGAGPGGHGPGQDTGGTKEIGG